MNTPKVVYIPEQAGSVTLHLTVDEASLVRALIGATDILERGTRPLFDALVYVGIPKKYNVIDSSGDIPHRLNFKERE